jgi:N-acetyl-anhydromuramyl-L-alanine amidase AmpD
MVTWDSVNETVASEYKSRGGARIDTLQIHHATTKSLSGLRSLMSPGGRRVSANGAMGTDGHLVRVVPEGMRAFTSATEYDARSITVEVCNTSLEPAWGISDACHERLARLAAEMHHQYGMPLDRKHVIGHREVPGTYATACPGPSMRLDWIVQRAREIANGDDMSYMQWRDDEKVYMASDNANFRVIRNAYGVDVSAADIFRALEAKQDAILAGVSDVQGRQATVSASVNSIKAAIDKSSAEGVADEIADEVLATLGPQLGKAVVDSIGARLVAS